MLTTQNPDPNARSQFALWRPFIAIWHWLFPPSVAHADRQSKTARWTAMALRLSLALAILVLAAFFARPVHHIWNHWRSNVALHEAEALQKEADQFREVDRRKEYNDAIVRTFQKATLAYQKDPDNPEAIRLLARLYSIAGRDEASHMWRRLEEKDKLNDEDNAFRLQSLALRNDDANARKQLDEILSTDAPTKSMIAKADQILPALNRVTQLLEMLKKYCVANPDDLDAKLTLHERMLQFGTDPEKEVALRGVWTAAENETETGLKAIEFLNTLNLSKDDQRRLVTRLQEHPLVKETHRIAALRRLAALEPEKREQIMNEAIAAHKNVTGDALVPLIRWLVEEREAEKVVAFAKEDTILANRDLFANYLTALTLLQRYDDIGRLVKDPRSPLTTAEKDFHLVNLAFLRREFGGDPGKKPIDDLIMGAVHSAVQENRTDQLLKLGGYAEQRKLFKVAAEAYRTSTHAFKIERSAYEGLLRCSYLSGNTAEFVETARKTVERWPDNKSYLERLIYSCLITGNEIEVRGQQANELLKARPHDTQLKLLVALFDHRLGDSASVGKTLQNSNLDDLTAGQRAVFCGLTRYAGFGGQAMDLSKTVSDDQPILPEEKQYLEYARKGAVTLR